VRAGQDAGVSASRIVSLLPSVTETVVALGLGEHLVARSHECDFPRWVTTLPAVTAGCLPADAVTQAQVDAAVTEAAQGGMPLYRVDEALLADLAPDLVVTQSLCDVCAVDEGLVLGVLRRLDPPPQMLSLAPRRLDEVIDSVRDVAEAAGAPARGDALAADLRRRLHAVRMRTAALRPVRVAAVEWIDPPWSAGHWVPDQIAVAGGEDVLARAGERSTRISWDDVRAARPDVVVLMPCGLSLADTLALAADVPVVDARVVAVNASGLFSRPGPRLVDGVEVLSQILHPTPADPPPGDSWGYLPTLG